MEGYLAGEPLDFTRPDNSGYIAASGLQHLPEPNTPGLLIESSFRFQSPRTGFVWNGRKDVEIDDSRKIPGDFQCTIHEDCATNPELGRACWSATPAPAVLDHKSTSNLRWAKTADVLKWDVQANLYAYALMVERRTPVVDLVWVYYQTKGTSVSKQVHLRVHASHAARAFQLIEDVAKEMATIAENAPTEEEVLGYGTRTPEEYVRTLPPNTSACSAYGGCPYESVCRLTPAERWKSIMGDSIIDSLFARASEQDGKPVEKPSAPIEASLPSWATDPVDPMTRKQIQDTPPAVNPPESALALAPAAPAETAPVLPPAKKTRGTKKATVAVEEPANMSPQETIAVMAEQELGGAKAPVLTYAVGTLYVDCYPVGTPAKVLERYLTRAKAIVLEECAKAGEPVADYRFIAFGKGGGALALAVMKALEEEPADALVVNTNTRESHDVLGSLIAAAGAVVMGAK